MGRTGREMGEVGSPALGGSQPGCRRCGARLSEVWSPAVRSVEPGCPEKVEMNTIHHRVTQSLAEIIRLRSVSLSDKRT
ncbi:hypothetical protein [Bacteroides fragilis]|uniref:hypothetical protein n=1 Tax=Bacteroides fragilis TaxID=817 RepID=UPI0022AB2936|nr:hypothetical protein [Bacteroides fragilis]MCZ2622445.1 hypothetical protein [Bacteroides fragilis]